MTNQDIANIAGCALAILDSKDARKAIPKDQGTVVYELTKFSDRIKKSYDSILEKELQLKMAMDKALLTISENDVMDATTKQLQMQKIQNQWIKEQGDFFAKKFVGTIELYKLPVDTCHAIQEHITGKNFILALYQFFKEDKK